MKHMQTDKQQQQMWCTIKVWAEIYKIVCKINLKSNIKCTEKHVSKTTNTMIVNFGQKLKLATNNSSID